LVGGYSPIAFIACGLLAFLVILCFAEAGSRFRDSGGPYAYTHAAFGEWAGFSIGWLAWLARVSSFAALANLFVTYLAWFAPGVDVGWPRILTCTVLVLAFGVLNVIGVRGATRVSNALTLGKLVPLLLLSVIGLFFVDGSRLALGPAPTLTDFSQAVLLLVYAYTGFESAIIPAGEVLDPPRDVPFALIAATIFVTLVYLGVQVVCIGSLGDLGSLSRPLTDAAAQFAGTIGATVISAAALVSIAGTLNGSMLAAPRMLLAMAERRQMPAVFGHIHTGFHTPHIAVIVTTCAMLAATVSGGFIVLVLISTIARLLTYVGTCAAVIALRHRPDAAAAQFRIPGGAPVPVLALIVCAWLLLHSTWQEAALVAIALVLGLLPYAISRVWTARAEIG